MDHQFKYIGLQVKHLIDLRSLVLEVFGPKKEFITTN